MNKLVSEQTLLFLTSIQIGIFIGVVFDLIRIFRKIIKHPDFFVQIEDMLYWVCCAFTSFYMLYICNYAQIRPFIFAGIILGAVLYFASFSIWFMKIAVVVIGYIKKMLRIIINYLMIPFKWMIKLLGWPVRKIQLKYTAAKWQLKLTQRKRRRLRYAQNMEKKIDKYLKNGRT